VLDVLNAEAIMDLDTLIVTVFCLLDDLLVVALVGLPVEHIFIGDRARHHRLRLVVSADV
jgi:hypothetical protein